MDVKAECGHAAFFIENSWSFGNAKQAGPFGPSWPPARSLWILLFDFDVSLVIAVRSTLLGYLSFYLATQRAFPLWLPHSCWSGCCGPTTSLSRLVTFSAPTVGAESFVYHTTARALSPRFGCTGVRRPTGAHPILTYDMATMLRTRRWWRLGLGQVGVDAAWFTTLYGEQLKGLHRPRLHQGFTSVAAPLVAQRAAEDRNTPPYFSIISHRSPSTILMWTLSSLAPGTTQMSPTSLRQYIREARSPAKKCSQMLLDEKILAPGTWPKPCFNKNGIDNTSL